MFRDFRETIRQVGKSIKANPISGRVFLVMITCSTSVLGSCTSGAPFYLVKQGMGQIGILFSRRPVESVLKGSSLNEGQKKKLLHMGTVRLFGRNELGLQDTDSFQSFVPVEGDAVSHVVSAAPELSLQPVTWWFPFVGSVPYLGFFDNGDALAFQNRLKQKGLDTHLSGVAAYSTLGWFADPVFSSQLSYSETYLTGLVLHEMVHSTVWIKGRTDFNEALASFVEEKGKILYYEKVEGADSPAIRRIMKYREEVARLDEMLNETEAALRLLYRSDRTEDRKRNEKQRIVNDLKTRMRKHSNEFLLINMGDLASQEWNNASFSSRAIYRSDWPVFDSVYEECGRDLRCFITRYREYAQNAARYSSKFASPERQPARRSDI